MGVLDAAKLRGTPLSPRELQCLSYMARGLTVGQTATEMFSTSNSVNTWLKRARHRLGAHNTTHAVAMLVRRGIITKVG